MFRLILLIALLTAGAAGRGPVADPNGHPFSDNGCSIDPNGCHPPGFTLNPSGGGAMDPNG